MDFSDHITPCAVDSMNLSYRHIVRILHELLFLDASLSFSRLIPVPTSISFIHIFLGSPVIHLLPSPQVNIISFSRPFALITCSKIIIFCFVTLCNNDKPPSLPITPAVSPRSFSSLSTPPSASFSRSTFCRRQSSLPLSLSLSMFHSRAGLLGKP